MTSVSLVTGAAGFIGSNLVDYLLDQGHSVVCVDNESANNEKFHWAHENGMAINVKADITDYKSMKNIITNVDYVFHLAAESRLQSAIQNPIEAVQKNCVGTTVMLQCAREAGVERFVYSSTSSGYGNNPYPNVETQPDDCLNPYSASKIAGEKFCKMYTDLYGLDTVVLRYFNVFGDRSPARGQYAPVIGVFQRQRDAGEPLSIVGDGSQRRDFVHVKLLSQGHTDPLQGILLLLCLLRVMQVRSLMLVAVVLILSKRLLMQYQMIKFVSLRGVVKWKLLLLT